MQSRRDDDGSPLWRDPRPIAGIDRPRVASVPITGIVPRRDGKHEQQVILATEEVLHPRAAHGPVWRAIQARCGFLGNAWCDQELFFSDLMDCFFAESSDAPAWVSILPQRVTVQFRQERGYAVDQFPEPWFSGLWNRLSVETEGFQELGQLGHRPRRGLRDTNGALHTSLYTRTPR